MEDNIKEMYAKARAAFESVEFWPQEKGCIGEHSA